MWTCCWAIALIEAGLFFVVALFAVGYDIQTLAPIAHSAIHYSQAVKIGDRVETSNQGGVDDNLQIPESLADEIAQAFRNVERTLATHPERNLIGATQVRKNWTALLAQVPDIQARLITYTIVDELGCSEWHWQGKQTNGTELDMRGVVVVGLRENPIAWARLYMEQLAQVVQADSF